MFEDFYGTFATVSLTVTGLWMYVASARFREWMADRDHYRRASSVSVQLAFPGIMCLFALIDPVSSTLWRVAFGMVSTAAIVVLVSLRQRSVRVWSHANTIGNWVAVATFACIAAVAVFPRTVNDLISAAPRRTEFFLFCLLLLNGLVVAWVMLFEDSPDAADAR